MVQDWLMQFLIGTLKILIHPVFYCLFFAAALMGVARVKRERKDFHVRAENAYFELRQLLPLGILLGLIISVITIGAGMVVPLAAIFLTGFLTIVGALTTKVRVLSPVYTVGFTFFALIFVSGQNWQIPLFPEMIASLDQNLYPSVAALMAILLIGEGVLILRNGKKGTSPKLVKSKRGLRVGVHEVKRLWMLPAFILIPGEALQSQLEWWPVFTAGGNTYSLLLVPFAIGFHQQVQGALPKEAIQLLGKRVIVLGSALVLLTIGSYWIPMISIVVVALGIIGRELLTYRQRVSEENLPFYFSKRNHGLMVLGIIPQSPASRMLLQVGELITKVNGTPVHDEKAFYEALQRNRAHCKLEVVDVNGQVRFAQRALYEGDHHELGILFVQEEKKWDTEAS
ncbi:PDZ domain-containing protein [Cytobacillus sp. FJAT-54145]|uniref:PDZ domain-containing protein n=1 Tax=Cytobacillus spartinae TaxID=3299023 RepID=A0ABW6KBM0_9BACI